MHEQINRLRTQDFFESSGHPLRKEHHREKLPFFYDQPETDLADSRSLTKGLEFEEATI